MGKGDSDSKSSSSTTSQQFNYDDNSVMDVQTYGGAANIINIKGNNGSSTAQINTQGFGASAVQKILNTFASGAASAIGAVQNQAAANTQALLDSSTNTSEVGRIAGKLATPLVVVLGAAVVLRALK